MAQRGQRVSTVLFRFKYPTFLPVFGPNLKITIYRLRFKVVSYSIVPRSGKIYFSVTSLLLEHSHLLLVLLLAPANNVCSRYLDFNILPTFCYKDCWFRFITSKFILLSTLVMFYLKLKLLSFEFYSLSFTSLDLIYSPGILKSDSKC
jgi:hypothetical protein